MTACRSFHAFSNFLYKSGTETPTASRHTPVSSHKRASELHARRNAAGSAGRHPAFARGRPCTALGRRLPASGGAQPAGARGAGRTDHGAGGARVLSGSQLARPAPRPPSPLHTHSLRSASPDRGRALRLLPTRPVHSDAREGHSQSHRDDVTPDGKRRALTAGQAHEETSALTAPRSSSRPGRRHLPTAARGVATARGRRTGGGGCGETGGAEGTRGRRTGGGTRERAEERGAAEGRTSGLTGRLVRDPGAASERPRAPLSSDDGQVVQGQSGHGAAHSSGGTFNLPATPAGWALRAEEEGRSPLHTPTAHARHDCFLAVGGLSPRH